MACIHAAQRAVLCLAAICGDGDAAEDRLTGTTAWVERGDLSQEMVAGIDRFLMRLTQKAAESRQVKRTTANPEKTSETQAAEARSTLRTIIGLPEMEAPTPHFETFSPTGRPAAIEEAGRFKVEAVRWRAFSNVHGEGLLARQKPTESSVKNAAPFVLYLPDADQTPEQLFGLTEGLPRSQQSARLLAEAGFDVLAMALVNRSDEYSGNAALGRFTNQPHREWIYRQSYQMGRHLIGYEVRMGLAAIDCALQLRGHDTEVVVCGAGEGGLLALFAGALDRRIGRTVVAGYCGDRNSLYAEPIYRNLSGYLSRFDDVEVARLNRRLEVFHGAYPKVGGPPAARSGRSGAAPGGIRASDAESVNRVASALGNSDRLHTASDGVLALDACSLERMFGMKFGPIGIDGKSVNSQTRTLPQGTPIDDGVRQRRLVEQLVNYTQGLVPAAERARQRRIDLLLTKASRPEDWDREVQPLRAQLWDEVLGKVNEPKSPMNARSRRIVDRPKWTAYEATLDVWEDVFAWGYLLVPKGIAAGERRPVVVCQHGLEGLPSDTLEDDPQTQGYRYYKAFAARLAERGFVVFAPHNPYRGQDRFRVLQRKANPLGLSLFSIIIGQHDRILDFLSELPFVDPKRIAFYGLSYGGKTAMRVPAALDRYCLSICSADFNDWIRKCVTTEDHRSYLFTGEYEMPEWNLAQTFNYAEMAACICPRPFMVERGHDDGVAPDEWVAYEYAKAKRLYDKLGIGDRTEIEFFNGPHSINAEGTFKFLHRHLDWPEPKPAEP